MTDPDYKALCAELRHFVTEYQQMRGLDPENIYSIHEGIPGKEAHIRISQLTLAADLLERLSQAEPVAPTDEDLEDLAEVMNVSGNPVPAMRRALELWGNSQGILASSPQPEPVAPTDEEIMELMPQQMRDDLATAARAMADFVGPKASTVCRIMLNRHAVDHARAVLSRYSHQ